MTYQKAENRDEIDAYIKKRYHKVEAVKIGEKLGITKLAVRMRAYRLGLAIPTKDTKKPNNYSKEIATGYLVVKGNVTRHTAY